MTLSQDLQNRLRALSRQSDDAFDMVGAALVVSKILQPSANIERGHAQIRVLEQKLHQHYRQQLVLHPPLNAKTRALQLCMAKDAGFHGDEDAYDDLAHMNVFSVLETKCATALTLSLIYIHCARALGWQANAVNFPGYSLIRLDEGAERRIIDPFANCTELDAFNLRQLIKVIGGAEAELSPGFYDSISAKTLAIRHAYAIKAHFLRCEQIEQAVEILNALCELEPQSAAFWRERGLLQARIGQIEPAIACLKTAIQYSSDTDSKYHTQRIIDELTKKYTN